VVVLIKLLAQDDVVNPQRTDKMMLPEKPYKQDNYGHTQYEGDEKKLFSCL
jgi:hypothetical protein